MYPDPNDAAASWPFPPPGPPASFPRPRRRPRPPGASANRLHGLTHRQNAFCEEYVATGVAAEAARRAGYSMRSARFQGHRLLKEALVQARVGALRIALAERIDHGLVLGRLENLYRRAESSGDYRAAAMILAFMTKFVGLDHRGMMIGPYAPRSVDGEPPLPSAVEHCRRILAEKERDEDR